MDSDWLHLSAGHFITLTIAGVWIGVAWICRTTTFFVEGDSHDDVANRLADEVDEYLSRPVSRWTPDEDRERMVENIRRDSYY